jgi:hypothetical protein
VLGTQRDTLLAKFLSDLSDRLRIRVNPRFGSWNAQAGRLDAPKDDLSEPEGGGVPSVDPNAPPAGDPSAVPTAPTG